MAEGHRERLRRRFDEENIDTIPDYIVLERMLQGIITRRDTRELARTLIREFGGIPQVLDAPVAELCKVPGMGEVAASYIKLIPKFYRRYCLDKWEKPLVFSHVDSAAEYLSKHFIGYNNEVLIVMCLDANNKLLACRPVFEGSINAVDISIRRVLEFSLAFNATRVIIGHNHPQGDALPSIDDIQTTHQLYNALIYAGIRLDDHIIVADNDHISFAQSGILPNLNDPEKLDTIINNLHLYDPVAEEEAPDALHSI